MAHDFLSEGKQGIIDTKEHYSN